MVIMEMTLDNMDQIVEHMSAKQKLEALTDHVVIMMAAAFDNATDEEQDEMETILVSIDLPKPVRQCLRGMAETVTEMRREGSNGMTPAEIETLVFSRLVAKGMNKSLHDILEKECG